MTPIEFNRNIIQHDTLNSKAKLVALVLMDFANKKNGECFPSLLLISQTCKICINSVCNALQILRIKGVIWWELKQRKHTKKSVNHYYFINVEWTKGSKFTTNKNKKLLPKQQANSVAVTVPIHFKTTKVASVDSTKNKKQPKPVSWVAELREHSLSQS